MKCADDLAHIATELDFQVTRVYKTLGDLQPHGDLGTAELKFEELVDVAKRASHALRALSPAMARQQYAQSLMGWHAADTGE